MFILVSLYIVLILHVDLESTLLPNLLLQRPSPVGDEIKSKVASVSQR